MHTWICVCIYTYIRVYVYTYVYVYVHMSIRHFHITSTTHFCQRDPYNKALLPKKISLLFKHSWNRVLLPHRSHTSRLLMRNKQSMGRPTCMRKAKSLNLFVHIRHISLPRENLPMTHLLRCRFVLRCCFVFVCLVCVCVWCVRVCCRLILYYRIVFRCCFVCMCEVCVYVCSVYLCGVCMHVY